MSMRTAVARTLSTATHKRSEEHTSELQSQSNLVCRLLLEKKKNRTSPDRRSLCPHSIFPATASRASRFALTTSIRLLRSRSTQPSSHDHSHPPRQLRLTK